jgi:hypothetical protein
MAAASRRWLPLALLGIAATSCGAIGSSECLLLPCPMPLAILVNVRASTGGAVPGAVLQVSGATSGTSPCNMAADVSTCSVPGTAGTYDLVLTAPGFETTRRTVAVSGTNPACGCPTVMTQHLDIVLASIP